MMESFDDLKFDLFTAFLLCRLQKYRRNNYDNRKVQFLLTQLINITNDMSSPRIRMLEKRFLK